MPARSNSLTAPAISPNDSALPGNPQSFTFPKFLGLLAIFAALTASMGAVETLVQRRRQVEEMSAEQREDLFRSEQSFLKLQPEERQRMRNLYDEIENDKDRDQLRAVMSRYCKWFEVQPPFRRATLSDKKKPLDDRVKTIKELLQKQGPANDLQLNDKNRGVLAAWLDRYIKDNGPRFIESMAQGSHPGIAKLPADRQQVALREELLRRWQSGGPGGQRPVISEHEMASLRAGLTPDLRTKLDAKKPDEQTRIITEWLRETATHQLDEELAAFFDSTAIDDQQRDWLMSLPRSEMYDALGKKYRAYVLNQSKPGEPLRRNGQPWQHGRHLGPPRDSAGRRNKPENRGDSDSGVDVKDHPGTATHGS